MPCGPIRVRSLCFVRAARAAGPDAGPLVVVVNLSGRGDKDMHGDAGAHGAAATGGNGGDHGQAR